MKTYPWMFAAALALSASTTACEQRAQDQPSNAQEVGKSLDKEVHDAKQALDDVGDKIDKETEALADKAQERTDDLQKSIQNGFKSIDDDMEKLDAYAERKQDALDATMKTELEQARDKRAALKTKLDKLGDNVDERAKDTRESLAKELDELGQEVRTLAQRVDKDG